MQVEKPVSNRSLVRALSGMTLMLVFCLSVAQAQNDPAGKTNATTAPVAETRPDAETPNAASSDATEDVNPAEAMPADGKKGKDRLSVLRAQIEAAKTDAERVRLQRTLVDYLVALGKRSEAVEELRAMARAERLDPIGFYNIANALARLNETDAAIAAYRKAIEQRHGNYARALNNLGVMLLRQGRWDEARTALTSALKLENFRYGEASYNLGRLYSALGEANLAIREWKRSLAVEPNHADAALALARAYAEDGNPDRGVIILDAFITRHGASDELTETRRQILNGSGESEPVKTGTELNAGVARPAKPAKVDSSASRDASRQPTETVSKAEARQPAKSSSKRVAKALRTLSVDRETYDLLERARDAREDGRNEDAVKLYRRVLSGSNGFFPPANLELGFVLSSLRRYDEATETLGAVAKREGARYPIAYYHLGRVYEQLGSFNLAAEAFEQAAAAYGDSNPQFLLDISRVREKDGNAEAALAAMESYVRITQSKGSAPDWSSERLAQLRQKINATAEQTPAPK